MRILHVGDDFAALRPCGLTIYAETLMQALCDRGHEVTYVFSGRHHPRPGGPRVHRWRQAGVRMVELTASPNHGHWTRGTRRPELDLAEPAGEAAFAAALAESRPQVVHIQELARLPSSVIDLALAADIPVLATLHDYRPLCASVRLLDADGAHCLRHDVGADCARNCAAAPDGPQHLIDLTLTFDRGRARRLVPGFRALDAGRAGALIDRGLARAAARGARTARAADAAAAPAGARPEAYQRRRDVNVERLNRCAALVAPSQRAADIYAELGVEPGRLRVQRLTLPHIERLRPGRGPEVGAPLTFLTLGGCASAAKGSTAVVEAVRALVAAGRGGDFRLIVWGDVDPAATAALGALPCVQLRGRYGPGDLDALDEADVGLLPSVWEETHGFVGIEMLAKGLPVIASALGGIGEYVRPGETGWLNAGATGAGLAALMTAAIDDPGAVRALRRSVRERREALVRPMAAHVAQVEELYAELAGA